MKLGLVSLRDSNSFPPGSLVYIATYLKEHIPSTSVKIIDITFDDVYHRLTSGNFDLIGISAMTIDYGKAVNLAKKVKQESSIPIVIGGVHISLLPSSLERCFDVAVMGEGEQTMLELLELFARTGQFRAQDLESIAGLAFFNEDELVMTEPRAPIEPLHQIPVPDWSLVNPGYFRRRPMIRWGEFGVSGLLLTSRGCPYDCIFCSSKRMWGKMRFHSPEWVVEATKDLALNHHVSHITIWDDLFSIDKVRLGSIAESLQRQGRWVERVRFACQARASLMDDEMCEILKSMNVRSICFGIESGSERVLKSLKTGRVSVEDNARALELCAKYGIESQVSVIFGSPGEKLEDMQETLRFLDFAIEQGTTHIQTFVMTPYPETEIWEIAERRGRVKDQVDWECLSLFSGQPLLLDDDVSMTDFQAVLSQSRAKARRVAWSRKVLPLTRHSPWEAACYAMKNPSMLFRTIFGSY